MIELTSKQFKEDKNDEKTAIGNDFIGARSLNVNIHVSHGLGCASDLKKTDHILRNHNAPTHG